MFSNPKYFTNDVVGFIYNGHNEIGTIIRVVKIGVLNYTYDVEVYHGKILHGILEREILEKYIKQNLSGGRSEKN